MNSSLPHNRYGTASPTLVLLHFFAGSQREWNEVVDLLSPRYECVTVDLPGFGDAVAIEGYSVSDMVQKVADTLKSLELDSFVLVGHSMSGKVALSLATKGPAGLRGLILVAPSPPGPEPIEEKNRRKMLSFRRIVSDGDRYLDGITARALSGEIRSRALDDFVRCSSEAWAAWLNQGSKEDWAHAVGVVQYPALVITGEKDPSLSAPVQKELTLPYLHSGTIEEIADCGHLPMLEKPQQLASMIARFSEQFRQDTAIEDLSRG